MTANDNTRRGAPPTGDGSVYPQPLVELTGFKRDLLLVITRLAGTRPHGVVIKREIEEYYDEEINHGRLYQNLDDLIEDGFVRKRPIDGRTNAYFLTDSARRRLKAYCAWVSASVSAGVSE